MECVMQAMPHAAILPSNGTDFKTELTNETSHVKHLGIQKDNKHGEFNPLEFILKK